MDSPHLQSVSDYLRPRTNSSLSVHSTIDPAGVRKRSVSRARSISTTKIDQLEQLYLEQSSTPELDPIDQPFPQHINHLQWLTPQQSPQPHLFPEHCTLESFPDWNLPTPPRSDSGFPTVSVDIVTNELAPCSISSVSEFDFGAPTTTAEMRLVSEKSTHAIWLTDRGNSSLGFLLPSQYGNGLYDTEANSKREHSLSMIIN
jgi:hypothetical protein